MPAIDCAKDLRSFHDQNVTLAQSDQSEMHDRRHNGRTRLRTGLEAEEHPLPQISASQGSYQMRTMVQDADNDYDIDDGVYFAMDDLVDTDGAGLSAPQARELVRAALARDKRLDAPATCRTNCVRQDFPTGYHIDVPVYRIVVGDEGDDDTFELASGDNWVPSDARAVTRWFNGEVRLRNAQGELNQGDSDGSQLRRVTKLTKKFSRRSASWKRKTTSGLCITKLAVDHFSASTNGDDEALRDTWKNIENALSSSTRIEHPIEGSPLLAQAADGELEFFQSCLTSALLFLEVLDDEDCELANARTAWVIVFSTTFFSALGKTEREAAATKTTITTSYGDQVRDDRNGRFG